MNRSHIALALSILLGVAGQMLFKLAVSRAQGGGLPAYLSVPMAAGLAAYALSTVAYIVALQQIPISVALPSLSIGYVLVTLWAVLVWKEPYAPTQAAGLALVIAGVVLLNRA